MESTRRRTGLRDFLVECRARLRPDDVGLVSVGRRRVPGLRREEVAQLADISPAWYTLLETARNIRVSPRMLDRVAAALRLSEDEKVFFFSLALDEMPTVSRAALDSAGSGGRELRELRAFVRRSRAASSEQEVGELASDLLFDLVRPAEAAYFVSADLASETFRLTADRTAAGFPALPREPMSFSQVHDAHQVLVEGNLFEETDATKAAHAVFGPAAQDRGLGRFMSAGIKSYHFNGAIGYFQVARGTFTERERALLSLLSEVIGLAFETRV